MLFIECKGRSTYINAERIESIWISDLGNNNDYSLRCTMTSGEDYNLYAADKKTIDYLNTKLVSDLARRTMETGIIDLDALL